MIATRVLLRFVLTLCVLAALAGCDASSSGEECILRGSCDPIEDRSEFIEADWGPASRLAVVYTPRDSTGELRQALTGLYTMNVDGTGLAALVLQSSVGAPISSPRWSPAGDQIAFEAGAQVYRVSVSGGAPVQLTTSDRGRFEPSWSPDGRWIAFQVWQGARADRGLWVVRDDGTGEHPLRRPPPEWMCLECPPVPPGQGTYGYEPDWVVRGPAWSPSGPTIAYVAFEQELGQVHLALYDSTTARVSLVYSGASTLRSPRVSSTGRIAFVSDNPRRIGITSGTGPVRWLAGSDAVSVSWSPEGDRLLYRTRPGTGGAGGGDLWIINADGTGRRQLTFSTGRAPAL